MRSHGGTHVSAFPSSVRGAPPAAAALSTFDTAAGLEQALGCPFDPGTGISFARGVHADEHETAPTAGFDAARAAGVHEYLVPVGEGGRLTSFEALYGVVRAISRRDLTISVGFGSTFLAGAPVWLWGTQSQRSRVAESVLAGGFGTAGISEDAAGSDLLATRTSAAPIEGGYLLDGRKWLIGNGRRSTFATVLAASEPSYGLFLLDFAAIGNAGVRRLPKVRTLGLRGHDLSGVEFDRCRIDADAALGRPGRGIEMVSGALQYTRTLVGGMSLGAADTGLRIALRHARDRILYGRPALVLPPVTSLLARAFADVLVAECTQLAAARGVDVAPRRMGLWSAVAKYVVPGLCTDAVSACAEVLSARAYLRDGVAGGAFQKLARDVAITPVFEGTRLVQLEAIRAQLASGVRRPARPAVPVSLLFAFGDPPADWTPAQSHPSITYGGADEVVDLLDSAVARLDGDNELHTIGRSLLMVRDETREAVRGSATHRSAEAYDVARRHALVHAAACCLHTWLERRVALGDLAADRAWLAVGLRRVLERLGVPIAPDRDAEDRLVRWLGELDDNDRAFSLVPLQLARQRHE